MLRHTKVACMDNSTCIVIWQRLHSEIMHVSYKKINRRKEEQNTVEVKGKTLQHYSADRLENLITLVNECRQWENISGARNRHSATGLRHRAKVSHFTAVKDHVPPKCSGAHCITVTFSDPCLVYVFRLITTDNQWIHGLIARIIWTAWLSMWAWKLRSHCAH